MEGFGEEFSRLRRTAGEKSLRQEQAWHILKSERKLVWLGSNEPRREWHEMSENNQGPDSGKPCIQALGAGESD